MAKKKMTFEDAVARLEEIINNLESGDTDLDTSLKLYEEGIGLVRSCSGLLEKAEQSVKILQMQPDGGMTLTDFQGSDL